MTIMTDGNPFFDGRFDKKNWDGNPEIWRLESGAIVGESTREKTVRYDLHHLEGAANPGNFELERRTHQTGRRRH